MFSIVMPVWNKRPFLPATVAGVLAQSWRDFELVAVDDGSTDGSLDVLRGFNDPRIRIITQANAGPGAARNTGIEAARHDWIAFLDADDVWLPDHLAELDLVRTRHPEAGLIGTNYVTCRRDGGFRMPAPNGRSIAEIDFFDTALPFCTSSVAVAKLVYRSVGRFSNVVPGQDSEYWARVALRHPVAVSTRVTALYRLDTGGISDTPESPWLGKPIRSAADIAPSTAFLLAGCPELDLARTRPTVRHYVDRTLAWCVRRAAKSGDVSTLRALPPLFWRPPPLEDRLIFMVARLPMPVARIAYRIGLKSKRAWRRLSRFPGH